MSLEDVFVDGCASGLIAEHGADAGLPILKPWRIATSCAELRDDFRACRCPGHDKHAPCAGKDTELTGFYTDQFVDVVHKAYRRRCDAMSVTEQVRPRPILSGTIDASIASLLGVPSSEVQPQRTDATSGL